MLKAPVLDTFDTEDPLRQGKEHIIEDFKDLVQKLGPMPDCKETVDQPKPMPVWQSPCLYLHAAFVRLCSTHHMKSNSGSRWDACLPLHIHKLSVPCAH